MILTDEMSTAIELIKNSNEALYITGKAGTGKTTLLKYIIKNIEKNFVITAPTGVAATNVEGVTLHSLFKIPFGVLTPNQKVEFNLNKARVALLKAMDVLIIDEISMVRVDIMDHIDEKLRIYRKSSKPFGGVQVVMFGDLYQLPPVVVKNEKEILSLFYESPYFFHAHVFKEIGFRVVELNHVFRQSDIEFVELLNRIRSYAPSSEDLDILSGLRNKGADTDFENGHIHICSFKKDVQKINEQMLGKATHVFEAIIKNDFDIKQAPCDDKLALRQGARVMMLINNKEDEYYNGSLGTIFSITDNCITVLLDSGKYVVANRHTWSAFDYVVEDDKIIKKTKGTCSQFPITLAWAMTIHKSQGLTFDKVAIHAKGTFTPGQIYVALSRCTAIDGIAVDSFISKKHIIPDKSLLEFEKQYKRNDNYYKTVNNESH